MHRCHLLGLRVSRRNSQRRARADGSSIVTITARRIGSDGRRRVASAGRATRGTRRERHERARGWAADVSESFQISKV